MNLCRAGWSAVVVAGAALLFASDASGQGSPIVPETRSIHLGPASLYPTIAVRDVGMDSNVFNDATGTKGDFTYSITPRVYAVTSLANTRFTGRGFGNLVYYNTYKNQQSTSLWGEGRYEVVSPGFRPFVSAGFADRAERHGYEIDLRARQRQVTAMVGADVDITPVTAVAAWAIRTSTRWDADDVYLGVNLANQLDNVSNIVAGGLRYRLTPLTKVVVAAEVQRDRFDRTPLRDTDSLKIGPSVEFDSTAAISGHVSAHYRSIKPLSSSVATFSGLVTLAQVRYLFRDLTKVELDAKRDMDYSYDPLHPYALQSGGWMRLTQRVVGPLELIAIGERRDRRHQRLGEVAFDGRREITRGVGGGIGFQYRKQLRFELVYERTSRTSSEPGGRDFERTRLFGFVGYGQ